jgi:hypothetical protein
MSAREDRTHGGEALVSAELSGGTAAGQGFFGLTHVIFPIGKIASLPPAFHAYS